MAFRTHFEVLTGAVDGVNTVFTTSTAYVANSTTLFLRGLVRRSECPDGWVETDPLTGVVTLNEPPIAGDIVQLMWLEDVGDALSTEITEMSASIEALDVTLEGIVDQPSEIVGCLAQDSVLIASTGSVSDISGNLSNVEPLCGIICECDQ